MTSANDEPKQPADTEDSTDRQDQPSDRKLTVIGHHTTTPTPPPPTQSGEVIRDLVVPKPSDDASKSGDPRSPGIQDRAAIVPTPPPQAEQEVVRRLIVLPETDSEESDESRSPGIQDRDVVVPPPPPKETEDVEVIREIIIPRAQAESEDKATDS